MKPISMALNFGKHQNSIQKMLMISDRNKIAIFCEESNQIDFVNLDSTSTQHHMKPLILNNQELIVETLIPKRSKEGGKYKDKKDVVVANYKSSILDMIYIDDGKYNMLLTSSSDCMIRGWDVSTNIPSAAKQPEN
jgi:hypothetical protein